MKMAIFYINCPNYTIILNINFALMRRLDSKETRQLYFYFFVNYLKGLFYLIFNSIFNDTQYLFFIVYIHCRVDFFFSHSYSATSTLRTDQLMIAAAALPLLEIEFESD